MLRGMALNPAPLADLTISGLMSVCRAVSGARVAVISTEIGLFGLDRAFRSLVAALRVETVVPEVITTQAYTAYKCWRDVI